MKRVARSKRAPAQACALGVVAALASGCSQQSTATQLRALQTSGEVSFLCLSHGPDGVVTEGQARELCPDFEHDTAIEPAHRRMHALVTQPDSGEVALVDLFAADPVDSEPTQPGFNFLAVGAEPVSLVSTPGGQASFVSVREPGREGIFGLPTSCIGGRPPEAPLRDITIWPACRLPTAPGPMAILIDPGQDDDGDANTPPAIRELCAAPYLPAAELVGRAPGAARELCPADLGLEGRPYGRRKLAVALPSYHEIWLLDAQELLDRAPGSFDACNPEQRVLLRADLGAAPQPLPLDLVPPSASCSPSALNHGPSPEPFTPWPSDFALDDEQRLYVADTQAPVVHVVDAQNPCALAEGAPLLPTSYLDPGALITTRRLAVSPLTPLGKRFVYAVDDSTSDTAGSLIAFDVSPGSSARAPIVRERSTWSPLEPPDRIVFAQDVSDVEFMFRDQPVIDPATGVGIEGIECDPHPSHSDSVGARYRVSGDLNSGATPSALRGTFAIAALHSGRLGVVDVEDLNAPCRRPLEANVGVDEDIRGCSNDDDTVPPSSVPYFSENGILRNFSEDGILRPSDGGLYIDTDGVPTVTRELSCNVVEPHRVRSQSFFGNITGTRSASLRAFPTLSLETGRAVATDQSDEGRTEPRMLMARTVAKENAELVVGTFAYSTNDPSRGLLQPDPNLADRSSLLLTYQEPRAYNAGESFTATYEGAIGLLGEAYLTPDAARGLLTIDEGVNGKFCQGGVQDLDVTRAVGVELGVTPGTALDGFARDHADYVQILDDLLPEDDAYWREGSAGATCGVELFQSDGSGSSGRALCDDFFGLSQVENPARDLRIVEASEGRLLAEPRIEDPSRPRMSAERQRQLSEFVACCFPRPARFVVRAGQQWVVSGSASGVQHHVKADPASGRCVTDCNPLTQRLRGRAFELSCREGACEGPPGEDRPVVGLATADDVACVVDSVAGGIDPGEPGAECVFQSLTTRFAIYRGRAPSKRNMRFRWQLSGGFQPYLFNLTSLERESSPRSLLYNAELDRLFISDGSARGLSFITLRNLQLVPIY